jgi:hypothetical protein
VTARELTDLTMQAVDEDPAIDGFYSRADCLAALNEGQRLLAALTLAIERRGILELAPGTAWYATQDAFPGFLVPLRVQVSAGATAGAKFDTSVADSAMWDQAQVDGAPPRRVRPAMLGDLDAESDAWETAAGAPQRYGTIGWSLLYFSSAPQEAGTRAFVQYAGLAAELVRDGDVPEFPEEYHADLVDYAAVALRVREGAQELAKAMPRLQRFFASAQKLAEYTRARSTAARYDTVPFELRAGDLAGLMGGKKAKPQ